MVTNIVDIYILYFRKEKQVFDISKWVFTTRVRLVISFILLSDDPKLVRIRQIIAGHYYVKQLIY